MVFIPFCATKRNLFNITDMYQYYLSQTTKDREVKYRIQTDSIHPFYQECNIELSTILTLSFYFVQTELSHEPGSEMSLFTKKVTIAFESISQNSISKSFHKPSLQWVRIDMNGQRASWIACCLKHYSIWFQKQTR